MNTKSRPTPPNYLIVFVVFLTGILIGHYAMNKEAVTVEKTETICNEPDYVELMPEKPVSLGMVELSPIISTTTPKKEQSPLNTPKKRYTGFEVAMYYLKAHESFRPYEYEDGQYNSKGFGLNLTPAHTKWATKVLGFPARSRDWTYDEGQKVLRAYWSEKREKFLKDNAHLNDYQQTAILLHAYNTGKFTNIGGCCGAKKGCGRKANNAKAKRIKKAHNARRDFESRLYAGKVTQDEITAIRQKAIKTEAKWRYGK